MCHLKYLNRWLKIGKRNDEHEKLFFFFVFIETKLIFKNDDLIDLKISTSIRNTILEGLAQDFFYHKQFCLITNGVRRLKDKFLSLNRLP